MKLKEKIAEHGYLNFEEARNHLKFGNVEDFMVKLLIIDNLALKVDLLTSIVSYKDLLNNLILVSNHNQPYSNND